MGQADAIVVKFLGREIGYNDDLVPWTSSVPTMKRDYFVLIIDVVHLDAMSAKSPSCSTFV